MVDGADVVVLAGGISHERDVSLRSGRRVADALTEAGFHVRELDSDAELLQTLLTDRPDMIWLALHGASGEDGALRSLLDAAGLAYIGADAASARLAWDKPTAKRLLAAAGAATPRSISLTHDVFREIGAHAAIDMITTAFPAALVVKPARGGSAQGVTIVTDPERLPRALMDAFNYDGEVLVEERIVGTEVAIGVIDGDDGPVVLPAVEIVPTSGVYDFEARYNAGETRFYTPARLDAERSAAAGRLALLAHEVLGLRHLARVDLIVDTDGVPYFLEAQVSPGLTETSLVPLAIQSTGERLSTVYAALTRLALRLA